VVDHDCFVLSKELFLRFEVRGAILESNFFISHFLTKEVNVNANMLGSWHNHVIAENVENNLIVLVHQSQFGLN